MSTVLSDASKRAAYDAVVFPSVQPELPRPFQRTPTVDSYGEMLRDLAEKTIQQALWIREVMLIVLLRRYYPSL